MGNSAKLGRSFADIRNVCIFALPMRPELGVSVFRAGFRDWPRKGAYAGNNGLMAEWLGKGLQNLVQRFESASDLTKTPLQVNCNGVLFFGLSCILKVESNEVGFS